MKRTTNNVVYDYKLIHTGYAIDDANQYDKKDLEFIEECIENFYNNLIIKVSGKEFRKTAPQQILPQQELKKLRNHIRDHNFVKKYNLIITWDVSNYTLEINNNETKSASRHLSPMEPSFAIVAFRIVTPLKIKCVIKSPDNTDISIFITELKKFSQNIYVDEWVYNTAEKTFNRSPYLKSLESFMKRIDALYDDCFISHWFNTAEQVVHYQIRKKTWMEQKYNRETFINWLQSFLPDFKKDVRYLRNDFEYETVMLGKSKLFNVAAIETSTEMPMQIIRSIAKEHSISNFFEINTSTKLDMYQDEWWKLKFWWSNYSIMPKGRINKKQKAWIPGSTKTWHYYGEKKILPITYDISEDKDYDNLVCGKAESIKDIIKKMDITKQQKPTYNELGGKEYYIQDFYTNINPTSHSYFMRHSTD